eukprot:CAMPEP_0194336268 /NCGR_PEP_ID=MMETSP0171-20130528/72369_1 /TAXON_ID=218684 /ORGANISM="Corethron pennatum, Strain L29A3" /LENGTH=126 /DNA_ID=CAMNT_0039099653 /DNA_START=112 /DNA_END=492 /DNA_ORIENTATION=+
MDPITIAAVASAGAAVTGTAYTILKPGSTGAITVCNTSSREIIISTYDLGDNVQLKSYENKTIPPNDYSECFATEGIGRSSCNSFYVHIYDGSTSSCLTSSWGIKVSVGSVYNYNSGNTLQKKIPA